MPENPRREVYEDQGKIMISKECEEHGLFENTYWSSSEIYKEAADYGQEGKEYPTPKQK